MCFLNYNNKNNIQYNTRQNVEKGKKKENRKKSFLYMPST